MAAERGYRLRLLHARAERCKQIADCSCLPARDEGHKYCERMYSWFSLRWWASGSDELKEGNFDSEEFGPEIQGQFDSIIVNMSLNTAQFFIREIRRHYENDVPDAQRVKQGRWEIVHFKDGQWVPKSDEMVAYYAPPMFGRRRLSPVHQVEVDLA